MRAIGDVADDGSDHHRALLLIEQGAAGGQHIGPKSRAHGGDGGVYGHACMGPLL
jgi:hypothetical protein